MNRSTLILATALAFDLGVVVVGAAAAETPTVSGVSTSGGGAAAGLSVRKAGEKPVEYLKIKMTDVLISGYAMDKSAAARSACDLKHGKVIDVPGMTVCQLSSTPLAK